MGAVTRDMAIGDELDCQGLVELVTEYLEGSLPPEERDRFERHVSGCPGCGGYLDQMRLTMTLTGRLRSDDVEPDALDVLLAAFRSWKDARRQRRPGARR